jgi:cytosine/adenosine deaminase-related metal-dependent hydrolase
MIARKIPILLGTDSLASVPSLDLLQEAAILKARYPKIPEKTWLYALTQGAESLSGRKHRLELSAGPGLLWVKSSREELFSGAAHRRRWLACPTLS